MRAAAGLAHLDAGGATTPIPAPAVAVARVQYGLEQLDSRYTTYYGSASFALGRALLTTRLLGGCAIG